MWVMGLRESRVFQGVNSALLQPLISTVGFEFVFPLLWVEEKRILVLLIPDYVIDPPDFELLLISTLSLPHPFSLYLPRILASIQNGGR